MFHVERCQTKSANPERLTLNELFTDIAFAVSYDAQRRDSIKPERLYKFMVDDLYKLPHVRQ